MIILFIVEIRLNLEWFRLEETYKGNVAFFLTAASKEMEGRIFRIDMALSGIGALNLAIIVFYLTNNYQRLVDAWRRFRGLKSKTIVNTKFLI